MPVALGIGKTRIVHTHASPLGSAPRVVLVDGFGQSLGLVLIEAMAAGVPIIATNCGACPEIIESDRSGILVEPGSEQALAEAIVAVLSDPQRAASLARGGFERVRQAFDMSQVVRGVEAVYDEVLGA